MPNRPTHPKNREYSLRRLGVVVVAGSVLRRTLVVCYKYLGSIRPFTIRWTVDKISFREPAHGAQVIVVIIRSPLVVMEVGLVPLSRIAWRGRSELGCIYDKVGSEWIIRLPRTADELLVAVKMNIVWWKMKQKEASQTRVSFSLSMFVFFLSPILLFWHFFRDSTWHSLSTKTATLSHSKLTRLSLAARSLSSKAYGPKIYFKY